MRKCYDYDKRLGFVPEFNVWQQDFTKPPYDKMVNEAIADAYKRTDNFTPPKEIIYEKRSMAIEDSTIDYYMIYPSSCKDTITPAIIYYHGGGFICPLDEMMLNNSCFYANALSCRVILPQYRLAPENSGDVMLKDCVNMYKYALSNSSDLMIDPDKLLVFGDSAGGCLACDTVLYIKDQGLRIPRGMMLIYPVTDDELSPYESMDLEYAEWNKEANVHMWELFYKKPISDPSFKEYLIPMRAPDHHNMPPTYIEMAGYDSLKDQGLALGQKLSDSGNDVTCRVIPKTYHGFDNQPDNPFVVEVLEDRCEVMNGFLLP